jgi:hypothetical protein
MKIGNRILALTALLVAPAAMFCAVQLATTVDPDTGKKLEASIRAAEQEGDYEAAMRDYRKLVELYPNEPALRARLYVAMSATLERAGDADSAKQYREMATAIDATLPAQPDQMQAGAPATRGGNRSDKLMAIMGVAMQSFQAIQQARQTYQQARPPAQYGGPPQGYQYPPAPVGAAGYQPPAGGYQPSPGYDLNAGAPPGAMPPQNGYAPPPQGAYAPSPQGGYAPPPQGGSAPPPQGGYAPSPQDGSAGGYAPAGGPPPQQTAYSQPPPQQGYAPPPQDPNQGAPQGYAPSPQTGYAPPQQGNYAAPPQGSYAPPPQGGYAPPQGNYAPPTQAGYPPPPQAGYVPPQQGPAPPPQGGYAPVQGQPPQGSYAPPQGGYAAPQQPVYAQQPQSYGGTPQPGYAPRQPQRAQSYGSAPAAAPYPAPRRYVSQRTRGGEFTPVKVVQDRSQLGDKAYFSKACGALLAIDSGNLTFTSACGDEPQVIPASAISELRMNALVGKDIGAFHIATRKGLYLDLALESGSREDSRALVESLRKELALSE